MHTHELHSSLRALLDVNYLTGGGRQGATVVLIRRP